jgi:hypothetical protein
MFGLESLATLSGVKDVSITGLPEWYAQCLTLCIQGMGGEVLETDWPLVQIKRARPLNLWDQRYRKHKKYMVTTRKWYQPTPNWKEYAERNGIDIPRILTSFGLLRVMSTCNENRGEGFQSFWIRLGSR